MPSINTVADWRRGCDCRDALFSGFGCIRAGEKIEIAVEGSDIKKKVMKLWQGLGIFLVASFVLGLSACSSSDDSRDTVELGSSNGLTVTILNKSGRTAYVRFTGNPITIDTSSDSVPNGKSADFRLTSVKAGRIYISYDKPLSSDAPDGDNSSDADYKTRFDKVELTYGDGGKANLTAVDFYSIPMILETSIQGTTIEHLTLAENQTGKKIEAALAGILSDPPSAVIEGGKSGTETVRILSPVKSPGAYDGFDAYLSTLNKATLTIAGVFYGTPSRSYHFTGSVSADAITLSEGGHTISIPMTSLLYSKTDLKSHNGIYTCNGAYTVDGAPHHVADNDMYSAVYRDLVAGFNLGFVKPGVNDSTTWWKGAPFQGTSYNKYAKILADTYPGVYGFPFTDRYNHILADLGGRIDRLTITLLDDTTSPPPYAPAGNRNPQTGVVTFNMSIVTPDDSFSATKYTFNTHEYTGGKAYDFPGTETPQFNPSASRAAINKVPAKEGLNIYDLVLRGKKFLVLVKVTKGSVDWGSIAGGGNANWDSPVLFIGGLTE